MVLSNLNKMLGLEAMVPATQGTVRRGLDSYRQGPGEREESCSQGVGTPEGETGQFWGLCFPKKQSGRLSRQKADTCSSPIPDKKLGSTPLASYE